MERRRWSGLLLHVQATTVPWLSEGRLPAPRSWVQHVSGVETVADLDALRRSVRWGVAFGDAAWQRATAAKFGRASALRSVGRAQKGRVLEI